MSPEFVKCGENHRSDTILEMVGCESCCQEFPEYKSNKQHLDFIETRRSNTND